MERREVQDNVGLTVLPTILIVERLRSGPPQRNVISIEIYFTDCSS